MFSMGETMPNARFVASVRRAGVGGEIFVDNLSLLIRLLFGCDPPV